MQTTKEIRRMYETCSDCYFTDVTIDIDKIFAEIEPVGWQYTEKSGTPLLSRFPPSSYAPEELSENEVIYEPLITISQARALAERCMAEQREIDAKICEDYYANCPMENKTEYEQGYDVGCDECAEAIRSQQPASEQKGE